MSTIDIREEPRTVDVIRFSDETDDAACLVVHDEYNEGVKLQDESGNTHLVLIADIPNMIKALQKAYELWGDE